MLVSAPAGFGKTTLLTEWLAARPAALADEQLAAWLSLDRSDNDPASFWAYVIAALRTVVSGVGESALALLDAPPEFRRSQPSLAGISLVERVSPSVPRPRSVCRPHARRHCHPEQMATARLGGFTPQFGFFAFVAGSLAFAAFGSNRFLSSGADSTITPIFAGGLAALASAGSPDYLTLAAALALMVGCCLSLREFSGWAGSPTCSRFR